MRRSFFIPVIAVTVLATAQAAIAQRPRESREPDRLNSGPISAGRAAVGSCCNGTLTGAELARITVRLANADEMIGEGRLAEAKRALQLTLDEQRRGGAYPAVTLRMLANVEFALDRPVAAATALRELAAEAARLADPDTELVALLDALWVYQQLGRRSPQRELAARIRLLMESPGISEETRRTVAHRTP